MIMLAVLAANAIISATISGRLRPQLRRLIGAGQVGLFRQSPVTTDLRLVWVARLCLRIRERAGGTRPALPLAISVSASAAAGSRRPCGSMRW
jgi:hypothetical protein